MGTCPGKAPEVSYQISAGPGWAGGGAGRAQGRPTFKFEGRSGAPGEGGSPRGGVGRAGEVSETVLAEPSKNTWGSLHSGSADQHVRRAEQPHITLLYHTRDGLVRISNTATPMLLVGATKNQLE
jgi:hypothetical protein